MLGGVTLSLILNRSRSSDIVATVVVEQASMNAMARRTCPLAFSAYLLTAFFARWNAVADPAYCRAITYERNSYTV